MSSPPARHDFELQEEALFVLDSKQGCRNGSGCTFAHGTEDALTPPGLSGPGPSSEVPLLRATPVASTAASAPSPFRAVGMYNPATGVFQESESDRHSASRNGFEQF